MTRFLDGPAQGQTLMLKRAPIFIRAVVLAGKWDALDQPTDEPQPGEQVIAYTLDAKPISCHLSIRGQGGKRGGGFYQIAQYRVCATQPTAEEARGEQWIAWCQKHQHEIKPEILNGTAS